MERGADGELAGAAPDGAKHTSWSAGLSGKGKSGGDPHTLLDYDATATGYEPHASRRASAPRRDDDTHGALEIEFDNDEETAAPSPFPAGRPRDLRPAALTMLAAAVLGTALWATHGAATPGPVAGSASTAPVARDYAAYVVTVGYQGSHLLSQERRRVEVDLRVTPVPGAKVRIIAYYINENGVVAHADPPPAAAALPAAGTDVKLDLTVTDCATVPIGESMGFVDVIADGPAGVTDRFTILGERYAADMAGLLRQLCPGRSNGQDHSTIGVVVAGS